jgi:mono/diheme cytochrome c family protein
MARNSPAVLGRFHALWTLEGLGALDAAVTRELLRDFNPLVRVQAIRASETLYKAGDKSLVDDYRRLAEDPDARVSLQAILTLNLFKDPDIRRVITSAQAANKARGVQEIGNRILQPPMTAFGRGGGRGGAVSADQQASLERGAAIYAELCVACHGPDGKGMPVDGAPAGMMKAPPLGGSPRVQAHYSYVVNAVLHGLTGPIDGTTYTDVMVPMGTNDDDWIAAVASYVRAGFGNSGSIISPLDVARVRAAAANRKAMWKVEELEATLPTLVAAQTTWIATASHNGRMAPAALAAGAWSAGAPQEPGMWFQLELPTAMSITEIQFDSPGSGGGRGGRGTPAPPAAAAPPGAPAGRSAAPSAGQGFGRGRGFVLPPAGFPRAYTVAVSTDGAEWTTVATGEGQGGTTVIPFKPARAKFIKITQTAAAADAPPWSIQRLRRYQPPKGAATP